MQVFFRIFILFGASISFLTYFLSDSFLFPLISGTTVIIFSVIEWYVSRKRSIATLDDSALVHNSFVPMPEESAENPVFISVDSAQPTMPAMIPSKNLEQKPIFKVIHFMNMATRLIQLVMRKVEDSTIRITESLFTLQEEVKQLNSSIQSSLLSMVDPDEGLLMVVKQLEKESAQLPQIHSKLTDVLLQGSREMAFLNKALSSVEEMGSNLADVSEQTSILAINASIEAARVGMQGRGFRIIAEQVQNLSKKSQKISEDMTKTLLSSLQEVHGAFSKQNIQVKDCSTRNEHVGSTIMASCNSLKPRTQTLDQEVERMAQILLKVQSYVKDFTHQMQFQDLTQQVMNHILIEWEKHQKELVLYSKDLKPLEKVELEKEVEFSFQKQFTTKEEWEVLKYRSFENSKSSVSNDNVILFSKE